MKCCQRCPDKAKSKILTACGLIRLCRHCSLAWWAIFTGLDGLEGIGHAVLPKD